MSGVREGGWEGRKNSEGEEYKGRRKGVREGGGEGMGKEEGRGEGRYREKEGGGWGKWRRGKAIDRG